MLFEIFVAMAVLFCVAWSADVGYFVHITDVHIDTRYKAGTDPFCGKWTCCREENETISVEAGMFGTPQSGHCGVPIETMDGVLEYVRGFPFEGGVKPTAIFFTGDNTVNDCDKPHGCNRSHIKYTVDLVNAHILKGLSGWCEPPECTILRSMGNHDAEPTEDLELMPGGAWLVDHFADFQSRYVDAQTGAFFREKGYLSVVLGKMKIIAINTQWVNPENDNTENYPIESKHPMTEWMDSELKGAKEAKQNVIIIGHIPVAQTLDMWNYLTWNEEFLHLSRKYPDVIKLSLWGHTHENNFFITRTKKDEKPIGYSIVTASVTNQGQRNTGFSMLKYDKQTNEILDIQQFYNDIPKSNLDKSMKGNWHRLRSFRDDYGMSDMSPESMDEMRHRLEHNKTMYKRFLRERFSNFQDDVWCESLCKKIILCQLKYTDMIKFDGCL